ncbi:MAG TPA: glycosyltransferase family 4 protein [bacterium]|nr:glycosyltransferase family 4 protein [bacterium]
MGAQMTAGRRIVMLLSNPFEPDVRVLKEARSLSEAGYAVTVLCWDRLGRFPVEEQLEKIHIRRIQIRASYGGGVHLLWSFIRFNLALVSRLLREELEVIHCHDLDTLPAGYIASRLRRKALVYDEHESEYFTQLPALLRGVFRRMEAFLARRAELVLVTNLIQVRKMEALLGRGKAPVEIKNCPPRSFFQPHEGEEEGRLTLGWIGYLQRGTGIDRLVRLFDHLAEGRPDLELLLVGKVHPSFAGELEQLLQASRHRAEIHLMPAVPFDQVYPWYRRLDIAVLLYEDISQYRLNTPTKLFEAMAQGIPVVATPIGDVREIVETHACGLLVGFEDEEEAQRALLRLIEDRALRRRLGDHGYRAAVEHYSWEVMAARLVDHYRKLPS